MAPRRPLARSAPAAPLPFTRKDFYALADECRAYATALASRDPRHIYVAECRRMNAWLHRLRNYARLGPRVALIKPARPVARWQVASLTLLIWLLLYVFAATRSASLIATLLLNSSVFVLLAFYMLPERIFGSTVEDLEGKLLRVVETLEEMLADGEMGFSEAAYFHARDNLAAAHAELREQIDLAHRD